MRMLMLLLVLLTAVEPVSSASHAIQTDRLGEALKLVGFTREDLGYRPKGYWSRYPNPQQMAHKLPFFDDLFASPLRVYDFTLTMAMASRDYLSPEGLAENREALYKLVYFLGVDRKITGIRGYSANLSPELDETQPLLRAIETIYTRTGTKLVGRAFGQQFDRRRQELMTQVDKLEEDLQRPLAELVLNVLDAYGWRQQAFRNVDPALMHRVFHLRDLLHIRDEERRYHFEIDDLAASLDEVSLYYAGMKAVQAADDARRQFSALVASRSARALRDVRFDILTPIGRIVLAGTGDDVHRYTDAAILVDLGGNDRYEGPVGGTSLDVPISIAIDIGDGNDVYEYYGDAPSQGAGILGAGVLINDGGNNIYRARHYAQGLGFFGLGLLFDRTGDDRYYLEYSGQGAGYFGLGYHLDGGGDDRYNLYGDGQGFGGPGGVGVLANYQGDDHYVAEAQAEIAGRPDYHAGQRKAYSNAQGVGSGRRGDGSDGHNWAGGLGVLIDIKGNDTYESGTFSLGTGYMYGTGLLYDGDGDDLYRSVYFTQASSAHFAIGALIDEGGNDQHILYDTAGAGLAFGWDFGVSLLLNKGGNNVYRARGNSFGRADIRSTALFVDIGGQNQFIFPERAGGLGIAPFREQYRRPGYAYGPYNFYANSFGLFLSIAGDNQYFDYDPDSGQKTPSTLWGNNRTWQQPSPDSEDYGYRSFGVGMDVPDGTVPEFTIFDDLD